MSPQVLEQYYEYMEKLWDAEDVKGLCKYFFDDDLTPEQEKIVRDIAFQKHKRIIICCLTRYGKSWSVARAILLWIFRHKNRKVAIIAPTNEKTTIIRNHIAACVSKSPIFTALLDLDRKGADKIRKEVSKKRMTWKNGVEMRTLSAEGRGEQLMGFGADLLVVDEECDIDYETYRSKITRMLGESEDSCYIGIGNPWHRDNQMFAHWADPNWHHIHIDWQMALQEGRITQEFVDEQRAILTPREFQVLYDAEFPDTAEDSLIDWKWIEKAYNTSYLDWEPKDIEVRLGVDVAEQGNDLTVATIVLKNKSLNLYRVMFISSWSKVDLMPTVAKLLPIIEKWKVTKVRIDATGVGSGVYSRLEELKREGKITCEVVAHKGGLGCSTEEAKQRFQNAKAESYWHTRKIFEEGKISIPKHTELIGQLSKMKWELTSSEKIRIRDPGTKEGDTAEEKSPDFSDSLNIAIWDGGRAPLSFGNLSI